MGVHDFLFDTAQLDLTEPGITAIADGHYVNKAEHEIRGSGYVVKSLEAALWCFLHKVVDTHNFCDCRSLAMDQGLIRQILK